MRSERDVPHTAASDQSRDRALLFARDLLQAWERAKANKTPVNVALVEERAEALFKFLLNNFDGEITPEQGKALTREDRDYLSRDVIDTIPDSFVPLAIVRQMIWKHRVVFSTRNTAHWSKVVERYGRHIMAN